MDVIEEIIKFRKDLDDAKKEIKGISGKNKQSAPAKKTKSAKVAPTSKSASKKKPRFFFALYCYLKPASWGTTIKSMHH